MRPAAACVVELERQLAPDLNKAWNCLPRSPSEIAIRQIRVHVRQIGMVEEVEELESQLKGYRFEKGCVL